MRSKTGRISKILPKEYKCQSLMQSFDSKERIMKVWHFNSKQHLSFCYKR